MPILSLISGGKNEGDFPRVWFHGKCEENILNRIGCGEWLQTLQNKERHSRSKDRDVMASKPVVRMVWALSSHSASLASLLLNLLYFFNRTKRILLAFEGHSLHLTHICIHLQVPGRASVAHMRSLKCLVEMNPPLKLLLRILLPAAPWWASSGLGKAHTHHTYTQTYTLTSKEVSSETIWWLRI